MTLQLLHSEFPYIWWKFDFIFLSVYVLLVFLKVLVPWRNKIKSKSRNVVGCLNSCLPLFWNGSLSASCSPLYTAVSQGVIHWRPYDLASQSIWSSFTVHAALPAKLCWLALSRYVHLDSCTLPKLSHPHVSLSPLFLYLSFGNIWKWALTTLFYEFCVKQSADVLLLLTSLLVSLLLLAFLLLVSSPLLLVSRLLLASLLVLVSLFFLASLLLLAFLRWLAFLLLLVCLLFIDPCFWDFL